MRAVFLNVFLLLHHLATDLIIFAIHKWLVLSSQLAADTPKIAHPTPKQKKIVFKD
jgi:hypothetical protein